MKKLAVLALVPAAVAVLAVPAGADVPTKPATQTVSCNDGSGKSARVWYFGHKLAADNPCTGWLNIGVGPEYYSGAPDGDVELFPGAHFNWSRSETARYTYGESFDSAWLNNFSDCGGPSTAFFVYSYNDVRTPAVADPTRCA